MNSNILKDVIKKYTRDIKKIELNKNSIIYSDPKNNKFVAKSNENNIIQLYDYLSSRGFNYMPKLVFYNNDGYIYRYEQDIKTPNEQKIVDLIKVSALLHNKTVYYKDISPDELKEIYENLSKKIDDTFYYYDDLINIIESNIYMSPACYMLARNISTIFSCLNFCKNELDNWYDIMKEKNKKRVVLLHNNLAVEHLLKANDKDVLISWNKAVRSSPIYDFIKLYKNNYDKYDFNELYKEYNKKFPFLEEEKKFLFILLFLPPKIVFSESEMTSTINVSKLCNYLYITDKLFMENEAENTKVKNQNIDKK